MRIIILLLICCFFSHAKAQDTIILKQAICRFEVPRASGSRELGTGFIVAHQADTLYLVTAGHVLKYYEPGTPIIVRLGGHPDTLHATIRYRRYTPESTKEDLAICTVVINGYEHPKLWTTDPLASNLPVFYFKNGSLRAITEDNDQKLITIHDSRHIYKINMPQVESGDSGGPVFTCWPLSYLTGIILGGDQACEVLRISYIYDVIQKEFPHLNADLNLYYEKKSTSTVSAN